MKPFYNTRFFRTGAFLCAALITLSSNVFSQQTISINANKGYAEPWTEQDKGVRFNPDRDADLVRQWSGTTTVAWYFNYKPGKYTAFLNASLSKGEKSNFELSITAADHKNFKTISSTLEITGTGEVTRTKLAEIQIPAEGFYKIALKPVSKTGNTFAELKSLEFEQPENQQGGVRFAKWLSSPSVHLKYSTSDNVKREYDWLYGEIVVPENADPMYTFYMAIGFYRGYLGMQVNRSTERRVLFSVWDNGKEAVDRRKVKEEDLVRLATKGTDVQANSFGNEGTGGQSYRRYNWKTGAPMRFIMNVKRIENNQVLLSAWFSDDKKGKWELIASWIAPQENRYFDGFYSFIENFGNGNGQLLRKAEYYNMYGKEVNGDWKFLDKAKMTHTDGVPEGRSDYAGGISPEHSDRFYMSSGGYGKTIDPGTVTLKAKGKMPKVDLKALEKSLTDSPKSYK